MSAEATRYVWFDPVHVVLKEARLVCIVEGQEVPFPLAIVHPDSPLADAGNGDVGRLGVPEWWARQHGLCA